MERPIKKKVEVGESTSRSRPRRREEAEEDLRAGFTLAVAVVDGRRPPPPPPPPPPTRRPPEKKSILGFQEAMALLLRASPVYDLSGHADLGMLLK